MSNYITTHNNQGQAIFSTAIPEEQHKIKEAGPGLDLQILYSTPELIPNLSTEADIQSYSHTRTNAFPLGYICPPGGSAVNIATWAPNIEFPFHRTMTLDTIVVIEGHIELTLDSGESRILKPGDSVTQRGTMHKWRNVTPNSGVGKVVTRIQSIREPIEVGGEKLQTEWPASHIH